MWLTKAHTSQEAPTSISGSSSLINLGEKYNYNCISISEFSTTITENLTLLKFTRARTL